MRACDSCQRVNRIFEHETQVAMERAETSANDELREHFDKFSGELVNVQRCGCSSF